jgi:hypothetical protein
MYSNEITNSKLKSKEKRKGRERERERERERVKWTYHADFGLLRSTLDRSNEEKMRSRKGEREVRRGEDWI